MQSLKLFLKKVNSISEQEWEVAQKLFYKEEIKKDDFYLKPGQYCNKVSFVEKGLFRLFYQVNGGEKIMLFFSENQFLSDYFGFLTKTPSIRPIQALENSVLYSIRREDLSYLFDRSKTWEKLGRLLAERAYIFSVQRANRLLHDDFDTRLDSFIRENPTFMQRIPQYMIASYLDMTPETLSRVKRRLMKNENTKNSIHDPLDPDLISFLDPNQ